MTSPVTNDLRWWIDLVNAELGESLHRLGDLPGPPAGSHSFPFAGSRDRRAGSLARSPDSMGPPASQKSTVGSNHRGPHGFCIAGL